MNTHNQNTRRALYNLAQAVKAKYAISMCWFQKLDPSYLGQEIYKLALTARNVESIKDDEILSTFFTAEACSLLFTLPNLYWFWRIVERAAINSDDDLISEATVKRAMEEERSNAVRAYDLRKPLGMLTQMETALHVAAGLLVVKSGLLDKPEILRNKIFSFDD